MRGNGRAVGRCVVDGLDPQALGLNPVEARGDSHRRTDQLHFDRATGVAEVGSTDVCHHSELLAELVDDWLVQQLLWVGEPNSCGHAVTSFSALSAARLSASLGGPED